MATCRFCRGKFSSRQAVRGHLRSCLAYREVGQAGPAPSASIGSRAYNADEPEAGERNKARPSPGAASPPLGPLARELQDEVAAEEARLRLRRLEHEHRRLDEEEAARQAAEQARVAAEARARAEVQAAREREEEEQRRAARQAAAAHQLEALRLIVEYLRDQEAQARAAQAVEAQREAKLAVGEAVLQEKLGPERAGEARGLLARAVTGQEAPEEVVRLAERVAAAVLASAPPSPPPAAPRVVLNPPAPAPSRDRERLVQAGEAHVWRVLRSDPCLADLDARERREVAQEVGRRLRRSLTGKETAAEARELAEDLLDEVLEATDDLEDDAEDWGDEEAEE